MAPLPLHKLELKGIKENNRHRLNWIIEADENVTSQVLEVAINNTRDFQPVDHLDPGARTFTNNVNTTGWLHYRLHVSFDDGRSYYSNVIALPANETKGKPVIAGNLVRTGMTIISPSNFSYVVFDYNGRTILKGNIIPGNNHINTAALSNGMYLVRFSNEQENYTEKFMKQ
jgi:hypothetical protein